jgi:SEC-C motif-containing protein
MNNDFHCFCGYGQPFSVCCLPLITGEQQAATPLALMRSRYSAYAGKYFKYVLATYALSQRKSLTLNDIEKDAGATKWLRLEILDSIMGQDTGEVEFNVFYQFDKQLFKIHERSQFCRQNGYWRYTTGKIHGDSGPYQQRRNDECLCASGKKFKKCCL